MPKYEITMLVEFTGELEADSPEAAEQLAHTSWGETFDDPLTFSAVDSVEVEELEDEEDEEDED
jgi:hypothetical protein